MSGFDGLAVDLGNLHRMSSAKTRSVTPENPTGEKGRGGMATVFLAEDLDGDKTVEALLVRLEDDAHSATPEF